MIFLKLAKYQSSDPLDLSPGTSNFTTPINTTELGNPAPRTLVPDMVQPSKNRSSFLQVRVFRRLNSK